MSEKATKYLGNKSSKFWGPCSLTHGGGVSEKERQRNTDAGNFPQRTFKRIYENSLYAKHLKESFSKTYVFKTTSSSKITHFFQMIIFMVMSCILSF